MVRSIFSASTWVFDASIPPLPSVWFDGQSARAQGCKLRLDGDELVLETEQGERRYALAQVRWPERLVHGKRQTDLPDGSLIQHEDAREWDAWWRINGRREAVVVVWMQSWRAALATLVGTVLLLAAAWWWGLPALGRGLARALPQSLEDRIGQQAMHQLERMYLAPSRLPQRERDELHRRVVALVDRAWPLGDGPAWQLSFHHAPALGANAFALPGGQIVVTDDLVKLLRDEPDAILGVVAHELGHVQHHDGLDMLVRASLVSGIVGVVLGDAGGILAALPVTLATQAYSRDAERRADAHSAELLDRSGISPTAMVTFFQRMRSSTPGEGAKLPIAIASHPHGEERIRFFREWREQP